MLKFKMLEPEEYGLLEKFYAEEKVPRLDPRFSRVAAALEEVEGEEPKVMGFVAVQFVLHTEPIWIAPQYRSTDLWRVLGAMVDATLRESGAAGVYTQPTSPKTRHMCRELGYREMEHPLFVKLYDPAFEEMVLRGPIDRDDEGLGGR